MPSSQVRSPTIDPTRLSPKCDRTPQLHLASSPTAKCQQARCLIFRTASPQ
ncbi:hypothetical protein PN499_19635 [Kamptonema animale CS-326]|uniref:hypothetical protein n=1 Tax=Kamptonema animale TaxID=92934 RepID=UPI00232FE2F8|nr:hypothetical protein [Kamptonema animale]MDB9513410.1 hypothetical protein [Kamptonema animale CS-326]